MSKGFSNQFTRLTEGLRRRRGASPSSASPATATSDASHANHPLTPTDRDSSFTLSQSDLLAHARAHSGSSHSSSKSEPHAQPPSGSVQTATSLSLQLPAHSRVGHPKRSRRPRIGKASPNASPKSKRHARHISLRKRHAHIRIHSAHRTRSCNASKNKARHWVSKIGLVIR